jgi:hypothetical protein
MKRLLVVGCLLLGSSLVVASEEAAATPASAAPVYKKLSTADLDAINAYDAAKVDAELAKLAKVRNPNDKEKEQKAALEAKKALLNPTPEEPKPSIFAKYVKNPVVDAGTAVKDETVAGWQYVKTNKVVAAAGIIALLYAGKYIGPWMDKGAEFIKTKCPCHPPRQQEEEEGVAV